MILKLIGAMEQCRPPFIDVDPYVPLTVTWSDRVNASEPPLTLVLSDASGGAVAELKFEGVTKALYELVLINEGIGERTDGCNPEPASTSSSWGEAERFWAFVDEIPLPETIAAAIYFQDGESLQIHWGALAEWRPGPEGAHIDFAVDIEMQAVGLRLNRLCSREGRI